jgi:two-component system, chemotaxis family, protein-glutamate methylesterase/glutaminase
VFFDLIVVGASWGGLDALTVLVRGLPPDFQVPLAIVQHRGPDAQSFLSDLLQQWTGRKVLEPEDKEPIEPGHIYIAPANYHLLVEPGHFSLTTEAPVRYSRPSIDVMFGSAAHAYGRRLIGMVLTGANEDGSRGLQCVEEYGGYCVVQDPATAEVATMPEAALRRVPRAAMLPLADISAHLVDVARNGPPESVRATA